MRDPSIEYELTLAQRAVARQLAELAAKKLGRGQAEGPPTLENDGYAVFDSEPAEPEPVFSPNGHRVDVPESPGNGVSAGVAPTPAKIAKVGTASTTATHTAKKGKAKASPELLTLRMGQRSQWIADHLCQLGLVELRAACYLMRYHNVACYQQPATTLAGIIGCERHAAMRALARLCELGYLKEGKSKRYRVRIWWFSCKRKKS
jgi:hypothetical protein